MKNKRIIIYTLLLITLSLLLLLIFLYNKTKDNKKSENLSNIASTFIEDLTEKKAEEVLNEITDTMKVSTTNNEVSTSDKAVSINQNPVIGIIKIDSLAMIYPIINYVDESSLDVSVSKYSTNNLNDNGNVVIMGHNKKSGIEFRKLYNLNINDTIEIIDNTGLKVIYTVYDKYITDNTDVSVLSNIYKDKRYITVITCDTKEYSKRLIIKAVEK